MKTKVMEEKGGILLESVVALMILCFTIVSVMLMSGIMIRGHLSSRIACEEAFAINSMRDQAAEQVKQSKADSIAGIASALGSIVALHPGWRFSIEGCENNLYHVRFIHITPWGNHAYDVRLFSKGE